MLEACPWCHKSSMTFGRQLSAHWVECECGARGPTARNDDFQEGRETAEDLWNLRGDAPKSPREKEEPRVKRNAGGYGKSPIRQHRREGDMAEIDLDVVRTRLSERKVSACTNKAPEQLVAAATQWLIDPDATLAMMKSLDITVAEVNLASK